jgi:prepilin-type N-terminal cleavage/methylation domain-containing protein
MAKVRGFTLIELMIVIAIIVLLAATLVPVYETATKSAERASCMCNLKALAQAALLYADDNDGRLVPARAASSTRTDLCWDVLLYPYLGTPLIFRCPSDPCPNTASGLTCYPHSYGINYDVTLVGGYTGNSMPVSMIEQPAQTILFFDVRGAARVAGVSPEISGLSRVEARHAGGANFAFVAGNVRWLQLEQTRLAKDYASTTDLWQP